MAAKKPIRLAPANVSLNFADVRAGDVLLHRPRQPGVAQRQIANLTRSPYTHAAIALGNGLLAEALTRGGVQKNSLPSALDGANHVAVLRSQMGFGSAREAQLNDFVDLVIENGRQYDFVGALAWPHTNRNFLNSQMSNIARRYGEFNTNEEIAKSAFFCSALVVACFTAVNIIGATAQVAYPPSAVSPGGLYTDPTFGWLLGFLVPEGNQVPGDDPILTVTQWSDIDR